MATLVRMCLWMLMVAVMMTPPNAIADRKAPGGTWEAFNACKTRDCCEKQATNCLGSCAGLNTEGSEYPQCVTACNTKRKNCLRRFARLITPETTTPKVGPRQSSP
jgi:hypothetical protein